MSKSYISTVFFEANACVSKFDYLKTAKGYLVFYLFISSAYLQYALKVKTSSAELK